MLRNKLLSPFYPPVTDLNLARVIEPEEIFNRSEDVDNQIVTDGLSSTKFYLRNSWSWTFDINGLDGSSGGLIMEIGGATTSFYVGFRANGDFIVRLSNGGDPSGGWTSSFCYWLLSGGADVIEGSGTLEVQCNYVSATTTYSIDVYWRGQQLTPTSSQDITDANLNNGELLGGDNGSFLDTANATLEGEVTTTVPYTSAGQAKLYWLPEGMCRFIQPTTPNLSGLSATKFYTPGYEDGNSDSNRDKTVHAASFIGLDGSSGGLIYERGGTGNGAYIGFESNGDFIARCGKGTAQWDTNTAYLIVPAADAPSGDGTLVVAFEENTANLWTIRAWWNDVELTSLGTQVVNSVEEGLWTGNNVGSYLVTSTNVCVDQIATPVDYQEASMMVWYSNSSVP